MVNYFNTPCLPVCHNHDDAKKMTKSKNACTKCSIFVSKKKHGNFMNKRSNVFTAIIECHILNVYPWKYLQRCCVKNYHTSFHLHVEEWSKTINAITVVFNTTNLILRQVFTYIYVIYICWAFCRLNMYVWIQKIKNNLHIVLHNCAHFPFVNREGHKRGVHVLSFCGACKNVWCSNSFKMTSPPCLLAYNALR